MSTFANWQGCQSCLPGRRTVACVGLSMFAAIEATPLSWNPVIDPSCSAIFTVGLDGNLLHAPRSQGDPSFDLEQFGLVPIQTEVWGPMVWANLDLKAPSFEAWIDGMPALIRERGMNVHEHAFAFDHTWTINANWKVFQDNTIECYHCPTTHPEFASVVEMKPSLQKIHVGGRNWIHHTIPFRKSFEGSITTRKVEGMPFNYYYHWGFPATYLQYAGRGFDIGSIDVVSVDEIRFRHVCFMPPDTDDATRERGRERLANDATIHQDVNLFMRTGSNRPRQRPCADWPDSA